MFVENIKSTDRIEGRPNRGKNLKIAFDGTLMWVKDFDYVQINAVETLTIPYKKLWYCKNNKLYTINGTLPDRNAPALLWTPIARALPVELPRFNHNYFGINEKMTVILQKNETEAPVVAMRTSLAELHAFLQTAFAFRLQSLQWVKLNNSEVFIFGTPILPIKGQVFWQRGNHLLPAGYDFDFFALSGILDQKLNPDQHNCIVWHEDSTYFLIEKTDFQPLSLSSFRRF